MTSPDTTRTAYGNDDYDFNLIALAKMYGEACGELQVLRYLLHATADEAAIADFMMSDDAAQCGFATPIPATEEAGDGNNR